MIRVLNLILMRSKSIRGFNIRKQMDFVSKDHSDCGVENGLQSTEEEAGRSGRDIIDFQLNMVDRTVMFTFVPSYKLTKMTKEG